MVDPTTVDPIYEKQLKKEKNISRKLKKTLSSSWNQEKMSSKDYESEYELLQPWSSFILKTIQP